MKHAAAKPSRKKLAKADRALFLQAAEALKQAAMTDETHRHSGESDRLLRIASDVARHAAQPGSMCDLQNTAFDVAACINSARLVPGDAESGPRTRLLAEAAQALAQISETPVDGIVFPRTTLHELQARLDTGATPSQWRELAREANYEVQQLAQVLMQMGDHQNTESHIVAHGMAARISQLSEIVYVAAALHGEHRDEWGSQTLRDVRDVFEGGMGRICGDPPEGA
ncbi:hypothetical protein CHL79_15870 [Delftia acidovorans]|uniref:hypothetical protein n=1 Tax=Delftia acidovorans TaxID=80866 RepID=UPI000BC2F4A9|nr:hypothetical protein [Delftia acidovorans]ATH13795.1 hypothetical protein CHL79_15870 [Delftia acidovorans]